MPTSITKFFKFYAGTNLAKYLPGNVMHFVGRNISAEDIGGSQRPVLISSIMEVVLILFAALLLILFFSPVHLSIITAWVKPIHVIFLMIFSIVAFLLGAKELKILKDQTQIKWKLDVVLKLSGLTGSYILVLLLQSLIPVLIAFSILKLPFNISAAGDIINAFLVSWAAGFLAIGAPGGIGVREVVFCSILPDLPRDEVLLISVGQRIINMVGDITFFALILLLTQLHKSKNLLND